MKRTIILAALAASLLGCVSKKVHLAALAAHEQAQDSLQTMLEHRRYVIDTFELALARSRGANEVLLITQDRLQDRLDELQAEIDRLNQFASSTRADLGGQIQQLEKQIKERQDRLDQVRAIIQQRNDRLGIIEDAVKATFTEASIDSTLVFWRINRGQLTVSLNENLLFRSGSTSRLLEDGEAALTQLVSILNRFPEMSIQVIGHTDNQPVNRQSLDNWQYSALRAVSVTEYLTEQAGLSPNRVLAATKGAFAPRVSNETREGRATNRRVDILIFPTDGDLERELLRVID